MTGILSLGLMVRVPHWGGGGVQVCRLQWTRGGCEGEGGGERSWEKGGEAWAQWHRREACFPWRKGGRMAESQGDVKTPWISTRCEGGARWGFYGSRLGPSKEWLTIWWCFWREGKAALLSCQNKEGGRSRIFQKDRCGAHTLPQSPGQGRL